MLARGLAIGLLVVLVAGIAYAVGASHGMAVDGGRGMYGYGYRGFAPFWGGFLLFRFLFFLLIVFLVANLFRVAFFGRRRWYGYGPGGGPDAQERLRNRFETWHAETHAREAAQPPQEHGGEQQPPQSA